MMFDFTPQNVFLVVFCVITFVAYLVNRAHCYSLTRNDHEAH